MTLRQRRVALLGDHMPDLKARKRWRKARKPTIGQKRQADIEEEARKRRALLPRIPSRRVTGVLTMGQHGMPHWLHKALRAGTVAAEDVPLVWHQSGLIEVRDDYTCRFTAPKESR